MPAHDAAIEGKYKHHFFFLKGDGFDWANVIVMVEQVHWFVVMDEKNVGSRTDYYPGLA